MQYGLTELKKAVRVMLNMNNVDAALIEEGDAATLTLDEIIESKLPLAARIVEREAPLYMLDRGEALNKPITFQKEIGKGRGRMQLPDDFMRLLTFQMSDWERAVTEVITEDNPQYLRQSSKYVGVRGNTERPIVALVKDPAGLVLEFWSCSGGADVKLKRGRYLPIPKIIEDEEGKKCIPICEKLVDSVVAYAGYLTAMTVGEVELAQRLLSQSKELMV